MEFFAALAAFALLPVYWAVFALVVLVLWAFVVFEKGGWATISTVVLGGLIAAKFPAIVDFISNPFYAAGAVVAYALLGVLWSRFKWGLFLTKKFEAIVQARAEIFESNKLPADAFKESPVEPTKPSKSVHDGTNKEEREALQKEWDAYSQAHEKYKQQTEQVRRYIRELDQALADTFPTDWRGHTPKNMAEINKLLTPRALDNKGSIVMWVAYWPLSTIWFICRDMLVELGEAIYRKLGTYFQKVSDDKFAQL